MWFSISLLPDGRQVAAGCVFVFTQLLSAVPGLLSAGASPCAGDSRLLVPRRPFLPALSAQQTCCCCCGCPDILQPLCSSSAAAQILVPCSAAAQMLCLPCICLHPDTLRCPTLLHLIYPTGNSASFFEQRHLKPALQEV